MAVTTRIQPLGVYFLLVELYCISNPGSQLRSIIIPSAFIVYLFLLSRVYKL